MEENLCERHAAGLLKARAESAAGKVAAPHGARRDGYFHEAELIERGAVEGNVAILIDGLAHPAGVRITEQIERIIPGGCHHEGRVASVLRTQIDCDGDRAGLWRRGFGLRGHVGKGGRVILALAGFAEDVDAQQLGLLRRARAQLHGGFDYPAAVGIEESFCIAYSGLLVVKGKLAEGIDVLQFEGRADAEAVSMAFAHDSGHRVVRGRVVEEIDAIARGQEREIKSGIAGDMLNVLCIALRAQRLRRDKPVQQLGIMLVADRIFVLNLYIEALWLTLRDCGNRGCQEDHQKTNSYCFRVHCFPSSVRQISRFCRQCASSPGVCGQSPGCTFNTGLLSHSICRANS